MDNRSNKTTGKVKKVLFWIGVSFLFTVGCICIAVSIYVTSLLGSIDRGNITLDEEKLAVNEGLSDEAINIAVFGVDSRDDNVGGRSDAMMIVSVDFKHNKVKAVSIMRDSLVPIEGYGKAKINSAYAIGGVELAIKTLNGNFDMNITDYVSLNFNQLARIVDTLGGIEVEISEAERKNANKYIKEMAEENNEKPDLIKKAGTVTLYGYQAVAYTRIRYVGNADFERTERQREVMEKLMNKALNAKVTKYPAIIESIIPMMETSLTNEEILDIAGRILLNGKPKFEEGRFPLDGSYKTNEYYAMVYDLDEAAKRLHDFIYDDIPLNN